MGWEIRSSRHTHSKTENRDEAIIRAEYSRTQGISTACFVTTLKLSDCPTGQAAFGLGCQGKQTRV